MKLITYLYAWASTLRVICNLDLVLAVLSGILAGLTIRLFTS